MSSVSAEPSAAPMSRSDPRADLGTVLVTGASSGIGAATATALAARGYHVLAGVRRIEDAAPLLGAAGSIEPIVLDITDADAIAAFAERVAREERGLAGLVNNAGTISVGAIELMDPARWDDVVRTNILGTINVTQAALPALIRGRGRVINVSSPTGMIALPMFGPYAVSKFALEAFNDTLRREVANAGVKVICVTPGFVSTPIFDKGIAEGQVMFEEHFDNPDLHRRYHDMAASAIKSGQDGRKDGDHPDVPAQVIVRALTDRRPKTRYRMGAENRALLLLTRLLPDRALDFVVRQLVAAGAK